MLTQLNPIKAICKQLLKAKYYEPLLWTRSAVEKEKINATQVTTKEFSEMGYW